MFEVCFFKDSVIERHSHTRFMDTRLKQTPHYYGQKKLIFFTRIPVGPFIRGKIRRVLNKTRTVPFIQECLI